MRLTINALEWDPVSALRAIDAALNQPATHPADVAYARTVARSALAALDPTVCIYPDCPDPVDGPGERYCTVHVSADEMGDPSTHSRIVEIRMDLSATHATCPLDVVGLSRADDFNLMHDVQGIRRHLDRETGELGDCFVPRFAL